MRKTLLITGSTDGIGLATAREMISQGHRVLLQGRDAEKLEQVYGELTGQAGNALVERYLADLSVMAEVEALARAIAQQHTKLDVLINNAGVFRVAEPTSNDGLDVRFAVNTFAPYLLTQRLLPLLDASARVINLSALSDEFADASGQYFDNDAGGFGTPHPDALSPNKCAEIVHAIENTLGDL